MMATAQDIMRSASSDSATFDPLPTAKEAIADLDSIVTAGTPKNQAVISLGDATREAVSLAEQVRSGRKIVGIPYGLPTLDRNTLGLVPGELVVAGGRPGMGKTTLGTVVGLNVAKQGYGVGLVSMEMHGVPIAQRMLSNIAYDPRGEILTYNAIARAVDLSDDAIVILDDARRQLEGLPFWIEQERGLNIGQIAARARQMKARAERRGLSFRLLIVDHLGLIQPSSRYAGNRVQEITEITRGLKILAGELDICVLLLSQLSREVESRDDKRPQKRDFRDSGSIEQDADVMFGLFREAYYLESKEEKSTEDLLRLQTVRNVLEIEVLKQRQGPQDRYRFFCDIGCNIICELQK